MVTMTELMPFLSMQTLFIGMAIIFTVLGALKLGLMGLKLPESVFKTVFYQLSLSLVLIGAVLIGFFFAVAYRAGGESAGDFIGLLSGIFGIIGIFTVIYSLKKMMKFLSGQ